MLQQIWYKDFDKKDIDFNDAPNWTLSYSIYLLKNEMFGGIDDVTINISNKIYYYSQIDVK